jgi:DNA-binding MarR family transcriptional regulator
MEEALQTAPAVVSRLAKRLKALGYIKEIITPPDWRVKKYIITDDGKRVLGEL